MDIIVLLKWVHPTVTFVRMSFVHRNLEVLKNVYMGVMYPVPDAVVRFAFEGGSYDIVRKTRFLPVLAHASVVHASGAEWSVEDCPELYSYDFPSADVREVPPTVGGGNNPTGPKPRAREYLKMLYLTDIREMFDSKNNRNPERLA